MRAWGYEASLARDPRDVILCVLRATSEDLSAVAIMRVFVRYLFYSHHFIHASMRVIFNLVTVTFLSAYIYH